MQTGQIVTVNYNGRTYCGEVTVVKKVCKCEVFMISKIMGVWLDKGNLVKK